MNLNEIPVRLNPPDAGVRARIRAKRTPEMEAIMKYGKMFLEQYIPAKNTMTAEEFQTYLPLFRRDLLKDMSEDAIRKLSYEYGQRVCIQQPVFVIDSTELDPNGHVSPSDGKKHKIIFTLPAWTPKVDSINKLGGNVVQVAAECLANARSNGNPFDNRGEYYSSELEKIIGLANKDSLPQQQSDFKKYDSALLNKDKPAESKPVEKDPEADPTGIDGDWE